MDNTYFITITGLDYYYGKEPFQIGRIFKIIKEQDNSYDSEAIAAWLPFIDKIGYVANSTKTVYNGTISAGRLYDKIDDYAYAKVMFVTHMSAIAVVLDKDEVESDENITDASKKSKSKLKKSSYRNKRVIGFKG